MKILLTGATGFIGKRLVRALTLKGHQLVILSRTPEKAEKIITSPAQFFAWNPTAAPAPKEAFQNVDAVIHLAGEGIAEKRWNEKQKKKIYDSRVLGTRHLVATINSLPKLPSVFVSSSAIGYYGDRGEETLTDNSTLGSGFLANVCVDWENEAANVNSAVRLVQVRTGIVLGKDGGALKKLLPIFRLGMGGPIGRGKMWMSWIHVEDLVSLFVFCVENQNGKGPINGVAPNPVTNREFSKALGRALHRPAFMPAPPLALKLAMGELASLVLGSQKVLPAKAQTIGFHFQFPHIDGALQEALFGK